MGREIKETYFWKAFVPLVITTLVFCLIFVLVAGTPGRDMEWTSSSFVGGLVGGARRAFAFNRIHY